MADEIIQHPEEPDDYEEGKPSEFYDIQEEREFEAPMEEIFTYDISSDDKLWAALSYPIALVGIIALLMEDKKERPFIRFHAVQSIVFNVILLVVIILLSIPTVGCVSLLWLITFWPAFDAYQGRYTRIPVITNFILKQGWAKN